MNCCKTFGIFHVSVGLNALNTVARASEDAHGRSEAESKNLMARLEEASSKVEDAMTAATEATKLARQAKVAGRQGGLVGGGARGGGRGAADVAHGCASG